METIVHLMIVITFVFACYLFLRIKEHHKAIKDIAEILKMMDTVQNGVVHDVLLILREKAIQEEDYRKVADIDKILNKK